jgi:hypothetical protein
MIKYITSALLAITLSAAPALAQGSKTKIFKGSYNDGAGQLTNAIGDSIFYTPIKLNVSKTGKVTGTAAFDIVGDEDALGNDIPPRLVNVTGKIKKVKTVGGQLFQGKASGSFSDGTKWKGTFTALKGQSVKSVTASATNGAYSGTFVATKQ